ncbi:MAG: transcription factor S [Candidatus Nanoarchaeia archaeon]|nr:transcription factor S [Candidatus Nanoarchaeia archaeon]
MQFCQHCGTILIPEKEGRRTDLVCKSCGKVADKKEETLLVEKLDKGKRLEVIDKKVEVLPKVKEECPKCKHGEAYYWTVQTRAGDEAETRFFKCIKCQYTWRLYD